MGLSTTKRTSRRKGEVRPYAVEDRVTKCTNVIGKRQDRHRDREENAGRRMSDSNG